MWNYFLSFQTKAGKLLTPLLSTAPCAPAPGRRLIIIRNDYDHSSSNIFFSLGDVPTSLLTAPTAHDRRNTDAAEEDESNASQPQIKKGWKMLRTMFSGSSNQSKPGEVSPPGSNSDDGEYSHKDLDNPSNDNNHNKAINANQESPEAVPENSGKQHRRSSFRFTLEWADRQRRVARDRPLYTPALPRPLQKFLHSTRPQAVSQSDSTSLSNSLSGTGSMNGSESDSEEDNEIRLTSNNTDDSVPPAPASKATTASPSSTTAIATATTGKIAAKRTPGLAGTAQNAPDSQLVGSKYAGRALAEWALVVSECDNFFQRRRDEGVPSDKMVEVPALSVESFRK